MSGKNLSSGFGNVTNGDPALPTRIDNICKNPHGANDNAPGEDAKKTIYNEKADRSWVGGTIIKKADGSYDYSGTFKLKDGSFKAKKDLTKQDREELNKDLEDELESLCGCYLTPQDEFEKQNRDPDDDHVPNGEDDCCMISNPDQQDSNGNGIGDVCDMPSLVRVYATSNTGVNAEFNMGLDSLTAANSSNYSLVSGLAVMGASIDSTGAKVVYLTTGSQTPACDPETLVACCVKNKEGNVMPAAQQQVFRKGICPIRMVQTPTSVENDSSQYAGQRVTIGGIVTADKSAFVTRLYLEQSDAGPWSGVTVYAGAIPAPVAEGDSVIVAGLVGEYHNRTDITPVNFLRVVSSGNPIPGPNLVTPNQISTDSPTAESYEGVFVRCDPVFVADTTGFQAFGEWDVSDVAAHTVKVGHSGDYTFYPHIGRWMNIRGPMDYVYENFRIEPRRNADIDTINVIGVNPATQPKPQVFALEQNSPNPFNPVTNIFFSIPEKTKVELYICDVSGRVVKKLIDGVPMEPGRHKATWDGWNDAGRAVSSGVYFCKLSAGDKVAERKIVLLK